MWYSYFWIQFASWTMELPIKVKDVKGLGHFSVNFLLSLKAIHIILAYKRVMRNCGVPQKLTLQIQNWKSGETVLNRVQLKIQVISNEIDLSFLQLSQSVLWGQFTHFLRQIVSRHVASGRGQLPPQILADQKAPPGSGGAPHYYLPPQIFRLCKMPVL